MTYRLEIECYPSTLCLVQCARLKARLSKLVKHSKHLEEIPRSSGAVVLESVAEGEYSLPSCLLNLLVEYLAGWL